ncbi:MAG: hypothetical protein JWQ47_1337 [Glaciihabitans sp.]|nr:hypothetical protein [Glaciihabitans sp.]
MVYESDADRADRPGGGALSDIRRAEAARMLGFLGAHGLTERASRWLASGVDTPNVRALAEGSDATDGVRLALVGEIAADLGIEFPTVQDARRVHAEQIIRSMSSGENVDLQIYALSNGFTDEFAARARRFLARLLPTGRRR